ncbi:MAG: peptide chain release factor 1 [Pseudomonadota bacterium]|nr:peptide chain release factor 1 [Pseudomonadota bacterium]
MQPSIIRKLNTLAERQGQVNELLSKPETARDQNRFKELSKELSEIAPIVQCFEKLKKVQSELVVAQELAAGSDPDLKELGTEEANHIRTLLPPLEEELKILLVPNDPNDDADVFLEVRAGTGGEEAALFAGELLRMYVKYSERSNWSCEIISTNESMVGGYKEVICKISGKQVYSRLKFESGVHRVQRVPETESQGRIHTSACTIAILPEVSEIEDIEISPNDLRIDTYRASGAGGQHVNKTESAIRVTHIPTGIVVECQDERSQHKNRARAMGLIKAKLLKSERDKQTEEQASTRKSLVGSGDRSERIRTYNYPQGRVTDHRINLTLYKLEQVVEGDLNLLVEPLTSEHQLEQMAQLSDE